jgi:hypothetical protein
MFNWSRLIFIQYFCGAAQHSRRTTGIDDNFSFCNKTWKKRDRYFRFQYSTMAFYFSCTRDYTLLVLKMKPWRYVRCVLYWYILEKCYGAMPFSLIEVHVHPMKLANTQLILGRITLKETIKSACLVEKSVVKFFKFLSLKVLKGVEFPIQMVNFLAFSKRLEFSPSGRIFGTCRQEIQGKS